METGLIRTRSCPVERLGMISDTSESLSIQWRKLEQWERVNQAFLEKLTWSQELSDPLEVYLRYIDWLEETISEGGVDCSTQLASMLERTCWEFIEWPQYRQDIRYLTSWMRYVEVGGDPEKVFEFLFTYGVGDQLAVRYEEEAYYLECMGRYEEAGQVYERGIQNGAEPQLRLARSHRAFKLRQTAAEVAPVQPEDSKLGLRDTGEVLSSVEGANLTSPCKPMKILRDPLGVTSHIFNNSPVPSSRHLPDSSPGRKKPKLTRPLPLTSSARLPRAEDFPPDQGRVKKQKILKDGKYFSKNLLSPPSPLPTSNRRNRVEPPLSPPSTRPFLRSATVTHLPTASLPLPITQPPPRTTSNLARYHSIHYRSFFTLGTSQLTPLPLVDTNLLLEEEDDGDGNPPHLELSPSETETELAHPTGLPIHTTHIYRSPTRIATTTPPPHLDNLDLELMEDGDGDSLNLFLLDPPSPL